MPISTALLSPTQQHKAHASSLVVLQERRCYAHHDVAVPEGLEPSSIPKEPYPAPFTRCVPQQPPAPPQPAPFSSLFPAAYITYFHNIVKLVYAIAMPPFFPFPHILT